MILCDVLSSLNTDVLVRKGAWRRTTNRQPDKEESSEDKHHPAHAEVAM